MLLKSVGTNLGTVAGIAPELAWSPFLAKEQYVGTQFSVKQCSDLDCAEDFAFRGLMLFIFISETKNYPREILSFWVHKNIYLSAPSEDSEVYNSWKWGFRVPLQTPDQNS